MGPKVVEPSIEELRATCGWSFSKEEVRFIGEMRTARALGVGYGFMLQMIELEWRYQSAALDQSPDIAPGPMALEKANARIRELEAQLEALRRQEASSAPAPRPR
jgi:hypothetical protein